MLVLSRKYGGEIVIGDETIVITVVKIGPDYVKLGIEAPKEMNVHRREVFDAIKKQEADHDFGS